MERCKVCQHPQLRLVDEFLEGGTALAVVGRQFDLSEDALSRHRESHVGKIKDQAGGTSASEILVALQSARTTAEEIMFGAEDADTRLSAAREVRQSSEAIAKLVGISKADPRHLIPFWAKLKGALLEATRDEPRVREKILLAIESVMGEDA